MMPSIRSLRIASRGALGAVLVAALSAFLAAPDLLAVAPAQDAQAAPAPAADTAGDATLSADALDSLVAPIALYPDPLLAQCLVAATYPLDIVAAQQWLAKNSSLKGEALTKAAEEQPWDPSVQALVPLPDALKMLSENIKWTADLGDAFLAQQKDVMDAVQRMRGKAKDTGKLESSEQMKVETKVVEQKTVIEIQPSSPEVIYVPSYNPTVVYGAPPVYAYPPVYYPPYVPGAALFSFGVGMAVGAAVSGGWGWGCGWGGGGNNTININNNNNYVKNNNVKNNQGNRTGNSNWQHNAQQRGGAPYKDKATASKYGGSARGDSAQSRTQGAQSRQQAQSRSGGDRSGAGASSRSTGAGASSFDRSGSSGGRSGGGGGSYGGGSSVGGRDVSSSSRGSSGFSGGGGGGGGYSGSSARSSSSRGSSSMSRSGGGGSRGGGGGGRRR